MYFQKLKEITSIKEGCMMTCLIRYLTQTVLVTYMKGEINQNNCWQLTCHDSVSL